MILAPEIRSFAFDVVELSGGETIGLGGLELAAFKTSHTVFSLGYRFREPPRPGRFDVAEAHLRGCPSGPLLGLLASGQDVVAAGGRHVSSAGLIGDPQPGRCLVLTGDTDLDPDIWLWALHTDLLVAEATFDAASTEKARTSKHMTSHEVAQLADAAGARALALTHISSRYDAGLILREAGEHYTGPITVPNDFDEIEIPFRATSDAPWENLPFLKPGAAAVGASGPLVRPPLCKGGVYKTDAALL
jgi:ribonuclease Z